MGCSEVRNCGISWPYSVAFRHFPCADPESFARGGPTQKTFFLFDFFLERGEKIKIPL